MHRIGPMKCSNSQVAIGLVFRNPCLVQQTQAVVSVLLDIVPAEMVPVSLANTVGVYGPKTLADRMIW